MKHGLGPEYIPAMYEKAIQYGEVKKLGSPSDPEYMQNLPAAMQSMGAKPESFMNVPVAAQTAYHQQQAGEAQKALGGYRSAQTADIEAMSPLKQATEQERAQLLQEQQQTEGSRRGEMGARAFEATQHGNLYGYQGTEQQLTNKQLQDTGFLPGRTQAPGKPGNDKPGYWDQVIQKTIIDPTTKQATLVTWPRWKYAQQGYEVPEDPMTARERNVIPAGGGAGRPPAAGTAPPSLSGLAGMIQGAAPHEMPGAAPTPPAMPMTPPAPPAAMSPARPAAAMPMTPAAGARPGIDPAAQELSAMIDAGLSPEQEQVLVQLKNDTDAAIKAGQIDYQTGQTQMWQKALQMLKQMAPPPAR
jgi:hypothetical protein